MSVRVLFPARAGENNFLVEGQFLRGPPGFVVGPNLLGIDDAHLSLGRRTKLRDVLVRVRVHARDKNAIDALQRSAARALLSAPPDSFASCVVLSRGKD